jgi:hypothetical protein
VSEVSDVRLTVATRTHVLGFGYVHEGRYDN